MNEELPQNIEAESSLIACCCAVENTLGYDRIASLVSVDDFYSEPNKLLYQSVSNIASRGDVIDEVSLLEDLKKSSNLDAVGGISTVYSIMDRVDTATSLMYYADIVKEKSKLREIVRLSRLATEDAMSETSESTEIRASLESSIMDLQEECKSELDLKSSVELLRESYDQMLKGEYVSDVVKTHIEHLDSKLGNGGLAPGEVMVLAAPTSCGKSQLALNIALRAATNASVSSAIVSLEMPQKQVTERMITCLSGVNTRKIRDQVVTELEMKEVSDALDTIETLNIKSIHHVKSVMDLASKVRNMVKFDDVKMLIIDYLQLIPFGQGRGSKNDAIAEVSHKIKQLALELNIPIILLCQVGREGAKRPGGLIIHDLKDSGDIENDADIVLLLWPTDGDVFEAKRVDNHGPYVEMQYNVAKNREGERDVKGIFKFRSHIGRFY